MTESGNIEALEAIARKVGLRLFWQAIDGRVQVTTYRERFVRPFFIGTGEAMADQLERCATAAIGYWGQRGPDGRSSGWWAE